MIRRALRFLPGVWILALMIGGAASSTAAVVAEGVIRSDDRVEVKSKVAAPIRSISLEEGATAREGELLVTLANDVERAQVDSAAAEVERSKSALAEATLLKQSAARELERNLKVEDLITRKDLDASRDLLQQAETAVAMREKELVRARAQLALSQAMYENTLIKAPFDGMVSRIYGNVGMMPKPADTVLLDFVSLEKLFVEVAAPLDHLKRVKKGMRVSMVVEEGVAGTETSTTGTVRFVYPEIDPTTRMFRIKIDVTRKGTRVLPGMFAKVQLLPD
ncbi:MAG TPA: efflux RND transporter periplasmic adaptor subunit [Candidatus Polarisedimenticolia bacterium]|nr:efflux RND transporter periplasmic adaptor subunit [Candidatus Polarisedimenticolia bacterium]